MFVSDEEINQKAKEIATIELEGGKTMFLGEIYYAIKEFVQWYEEKEDENNPIYDE